MNYLRAALSLHVTLALVVLAWGWWGAYTFWAETFGSAWLAVGALAVIEATALAGMLAHLWRVDVPLAALRHALPIASAVPLLHTLHAMAATRLSDMTAWLLSGALTAAIGAVTWVVWAGIERMMIDPVDAARAVAEREQRRRRSEVEQIARIIDHAQQLQALIDAAANQRLLADVTPRDVSAPAPVEVVPCARCQAPVALNGRSAAAVRAATGRYGCNACRTSSITLTRS